MTRVYIIKDPRTRVHILDGSNILLGYVEILGEFKILLDDREFFFDSKETFRKFIEGISKNMNVVVYPVGMNRKNNTVYGVELYSDDEVDKLVDKIMEVLER